MVCGEANAIHLTLKSNNLDGIHQDKYSDALASEYDIWS